MPKALHSGIKVGEKNTGCVGIMVKVISYATIPRSFPEV